MLQTAIKLMVFCLTHTCTHARTLTRSPDRGLFLGRVGNVSSFGFVSIAQYEPYKQKQEFQY